MSSSRRSAWRPQGDVDNFPRLETNGQSGPILSGWPMLLVLYLMCAIAAGVCLIGGVGEAFYFLAMALIALACEVRVGRVERMLAAKQDRSTPPPVPTRPFRPAWWRR